MIEPGCYYAFGVTGAGKTYKLRQMLAARVEQTGNPYLILDAGPAAAFARLPHEPNPEVCLEKIVAGFPAVYTPKDLQEIAYLFRGVHYFGKTEVIWDECANDLAGSSDKDAREIAVCVRCWRQAGIAFDPDGRPNTYFITTQRPNELPPVFWTTVPEVYCFMLEEEGALDIVRRRFGFDPAAVKALPPREYLLYGKDRFSCRKTEAPPAAPPSASPPPAPPASGNS